MAGSASKVAGILDRGIRSKFDATRGQVANVAPNDTINAVSAARATYGLDCPVVIKLDPSLRMAGEFTNSGRAAGAVQGLERVQAVLDEHEGTFDAMAIASVIEVPDEYHEEYLRLLP